MPQEDWVVVRLKVQDKNRFIADMKQAGYATGGLNAETKRAVGLFQQGTHHSFLWNQALFTLRRGLYHLTQGVGIAAAAVIGFGLKFNIMMEQQQLAFRFFTGSVAAARKEVNYLFNLAAKGPFDFAQVVAASRQLNAFGFSVQRANVVLFNLQDAVAAMGLSQEALDRATLALGQIQASGRLLGQDLRQLEQLGLVNPKDLMTRLGLPQTALANIGQYNIPSKVAIDAIMAYWRSRYKGAAQDFQKTWTGQFSTLRDYSSRLFGSLSQGLFNVTERRVFPYLNKLVQNMQAGSQRGGIFGALGALDKQTGMNTVEIVKGVAFNLQGLITIVQTLGTDVLWAARQFQFGTNALYLFGSILKVVADVIKFINPVLKYLIALWILERTAMLVNTAAIKGQVLWRTITTAWMKREIFWLGLSTRATGTNTIAKRLAVLWSIRNVTAGNLETVMFNRNIRATRLNMIVLRTFAFTQKLVALGWRGIAIATLTAARAMAVFLLTNPIGWAILAASALVLLYFKWDKFHDLVNETFRFMIRNAPYVALGLAALLGPIGLILGGILLIIKYWHRLGDIAREAAEKAKKGAGFFHTLLQGGTVIPAPGHHASGGFFPNAHWAMVGEQGPELVHLPGGSRVIPNNQLQSMASTAPGAGGGRVLRVQIPLYLDRNGRQKIAEATADINLDVAARA